MDASGRTAAVVEGLRAYGFLEEGWKLEMSKPREVLERDQREVQAVEYAVMTALIIGSLVLAIGVLAAAALGQFDGVTAVISGMG